MSEATESEPCKVHPDFEFQRELTTLINKHGFDTKLSMPDYIVCNFILENLSALTNLKVSLLRYGLGET